MQDYREPNNEAMRAYFEDGVSLRELGRMHQEKEKTAKPIPKSLHTVTVLVTVAKLLQSQYSYLSWRAVEEAAIALGYNIDCDEYGLMALAVKKLNKL